ncbi:MAG: IclR family transcriptional regulator [Promicromonosporaceae bacterium]|nr:IclR family transcriptional regulator [Promicromonosporaceae bacterium]
MEEPQRGMFTKIVAVLDGLLAGPASLGEVTARTGLPRTTVHRLLAQMEPWEWVQRDSANRACLGPRLLLYARCVSTNRLAQLATPILAELADRTGEATQVFCRQGGQRVCIASVRRPVGLREAVPAGARLTMRAGSAAHVLAAWEAPEDLESILPEAAYTPGTLARVRHRGWADSVAEREPGTASIAAPVRSSAGVTVAAICVTGPLPRLSAQPGKRHAALVVAAASALGRRLSESGFSW